MNLRSALRGHHGQVAISIQILRKASSMTSASAPRRTPLVRPSVLAIADVGAPLMSNHAVLEEAPSVARATAQLSPVQTSASLDGHRFL